MKAEIEIEARGGRHKLAMPIAGFEKLEQTEGLGSFPFEMLGSLKTGVWKAAELSAIIRVGLEMGGASVTIEDLETEKSSGELRAIAEKLLEVALRDDSGNFGAAAFPFLDVPNGGGSEPGTT